MTVPREERMSKENSQIAMPSARHAIYGLLGLVAIMIIVALCGGIVSHPIGG